jgi:CHAT domain
MARVGKRVCLLVLAVLLSAPGHARTVCGENGDTDIESVLSHHLEASAHLMRMRGLPPPPGPDEIATFATAIASYLDEKTALLIFSSTEAEGCAVLMRSDQAPLAAHIPDLLSAVDRSLADLDSARGITRAARTRAPVSRHRGAVSETGADVAQPLDADAALRRISELILPADFRIALRDTRHLLIAPAGAIGTIPFHALPLDDGGTVLAERMSFAILPSLLEAAPGYVVIEPDWEFQRPSPPGETPDATGPALIVGDPDGGGDPDWDFPPLAGARAEAQEVAAAQNQPVLVGSKATLAAVTGALAASPRMIYFAAHGIADQEEPLDGSFIKLSDGRLTARAIQDMPLPPVPVVLSACQTGLGSNHEGGMIGLARAFDIAGSGPVLMSLWNIDDDATRTIMVATVNRLAQHSLPEALRLAVLDYRRSHPGEPEKWAAFSIFGR